MIQWNTPRRGDNIKSVNKGSTKEYTMKKFLTIAATMALATAGVIYLSKTAGNNSGNNLSETPIDPSNDPYETPSEENVTIDVIDCVKAAIAHEKFSSDLFIVPNRASTPDDYLGRSDAVRSELEHFLQVNGHKLEDEPEQIIVETWGVDKGHGSDNVRDHGIFMEVGDIDVRIYPMVTNMPYRIIKNLKEGDPLQITVPTVVLCTGSDDDCERFEINLPITVTAKQNEYRYCNWGAFEGALQHAIRHFC